MIGSASEIGRAFGCIRIWRGYTQLKVARRMDCSANEICKLETLGRILTPQFIKRLRRVLDVSEAQVDEVIAAMRHELEGGR